MKPTTDDQPSVKSTHAASEPLTPNPHSPRRIPLLSSPGASDDESSDTPRQSRRPRRHGEVVPDSSSASFLQLPLRRKNNALHPTVIRPHTSAGLSALPPMQRAYSSPGLDSSGRFVSPVFSMPRRPSSPLSVGRRRSPLRSSFEEPYPSSYSGLSIEPNIPEHAELEISSPIMPEDTDGLGPLATIPPYTNTFPRSRRRPASPLHQSASAPSLYARATSPHLSGGTSPALSASRFNGEAYPTFTYSATSSMPSTPTSFRSRSPSISSLETIEDTPDAEEAAMLKDEEMKIRGEDSDGQTDSRRRSFDLRGAGLRSNKDRKRWSVSGGERRADFSLEPIEE